MLERHRKSGERGVQLQNKPSATEQLGGGIFSSVGPMCVEIRTETKGVKVEHDHLVQRLRSSF